jgi:hypothetical protein
MILIILLADFTTLKGAKTNPILNFEFRIFSFATFVDTGWLSR